MSTNLGKKIRQLREEREWTEEELSKRSGVNRNTIHYIETGGIVNPSADKLIKIAHAFKMKPEELYEAAGYIKDAKTAFKQKETPEEILERFRITMPATVPIYRDFPFHAGTPVEPTDYIAIVKNRARGKMLEAYIVKGQCLEPEVKDGDIIVVDREGQIDNGDIVACLINDMLHLARLRKIADVCYLENNHGRMKLEEVQLAAPVIEVRRRLK